MAGHAVASSRAAPTASPGWRFLPPNPGARGTLRMPIARWLALAVALASAALASCCAPKAIGDLGVQRQPQETENWCWAAGGQMVMRYLGRDVSQCAEANDRFGRTDCCDVDLCPAPTEAPSYDGAGNCTNCACPGWPDFARYGFSFQRTSDAALSWSELRSQISDAPGCKKRPFAFSWHWPGGGGHLMIVKGYQEISGARYVVVLDPWAPCAGDERIITYEEYVSSPGHHSHWDDFYDVAFTGGK